MEPSLEYFVEIANELNISLAAKKLHISQQSLSTYLKKLEEDYGTPLLIRKPKTKLTEAGQLVYHAATRIQRIQQELRTELHQYSGRPSPLTIGIFTPKASRLLDFIPLAEFSSRYPNVTYSIIEEPNAVLREMCLNGKLDLMIGSKTEDMHFDGLVEHKLYADSAYVLISRELFQQCFPEATQKDIQKNLTGVSLSQFASVPLAAPSLSTGFGRRMKKLMEDGNLSFQSITEVSNMNMINNLVFNHVAWGFCDSHHLSLIRKSETFYPTDSYYAFPIAKPAVISEIVIFHRPQKSYPRPFLDLIDMIKERTAEMRIEPHT